MLRDRQQRRKGLPTPGRKASREFIFFARKDAKACLRKAGAKKYYPWQLCVLARNYPFLSQRKEAAKK